MKIHDCPQGSTEWKALRLGKPTASRMNRVLSPGKLLPVSGKARDGFIAELCAEWALGVPLEDVSSGFMQRGLEFEEAAMLDYEFTRGDEIQPCGFIENKGAGYSPDGIVGHGLWEVKTPSAKVHCQYLLDPDALVAKYAHQLQSGLYIAEKPWIDIESYHPTLPNVIIRVEPEDRWVRALDEHLPQFLARLKMAKNRLTELGVNKT